MLNDARHRTDAVIRASLNPDPQVAAASVLRALAAGDVDWTHFIDRALEHHVLPALQAPFGDPRVAREVPDELIRGIGTYCDYARTRNEYLAGELCELVGALDAEGLPVIPFKGIVLAETLYGDLGQRPAGDLDLLIRASDIARVRECLLARGYTDPSEPRASMTAVQRRVFERYQCEYELWREHDGVVVEPHWAFAPRWLAIDVDYGAVFERSRPTNLWNTTVRMHPPEDLLLALCIHGAKHEWERLLWIRDVAALIHARPNLDYGSALSRARTYGCARMLLLGLEIARVVAGATLPPEVLREIQKQSAIAPLASHVHRIATTGRSVVQNVWPSRYGFLLQDSASRRLRYLGGMCLPPRPVHLELVALPSALSALYFPLRWVADYFARPLWLVSRLVLRGRAR